MFFVNKAMKLYTLKIHMHMVHTKNQRYLFFEKFDLQKGIHKLKVHYLFPKKWI